MSDENLLETQGKENLPQEQKESNISLTPQEVQSQLTLEVDEEPLNEEQLALLRNLRPDWFLWEINALHPIERKELNLIVNYLRQNNTFTIPAKALIEFGITPTRSSLLQKLMKEQRISISQEKMKLLYEQITKENFFLYVQQLNDTYATMQKNAKDIYCPYPTSHYKLIDPDLIISLPLERIGWKNINSDIYKNKLVEIIFPDNHFPPILITPSAYNDLQRIATNKIIYHMQNLAGEDEQFFTQKIEVDKKKMASQYPRLFDFDLLRLQKRSTSAYRKEFTTIVTEKMLNNKNLLKMFLADSATESSSHIMRFFSPNAPSSFDFLQSFEYLKEIILRSDINNAIQLESINKMIFESLKLYLSATDIKNIIKEGFPELGDDQFESILNRFFSEYVKKKNRNGVPQVFHFKITFGEYNDEDIFINHLNLNRLINGALERISQKISTTVVSQWEQLLSKHNLSGGMFSDAHFESYLFKYCAKEEPFAFRIITKKDFYQILSSIEQLSRLTLRLKLYTHKELSNVFSIDKNKIYQTAYENVLESKNFFARLFFIIINWLQKRSFLSTLGEVESLTGDINDEKGIKSSDILEALQFNSELELEKRCEQLWDKLPTSLSRKELDENIKTDLYTFFRTRSDVPLAALDYIIEVNANRILKKGPHLSSYEKEINNYIRHKTYYTICQTSSLRTKISLSVLKENQNTNEVEF